MARGCLKLSTGLREDQLAWSRLRLDLTNWKSGPVVLDDLTNDTLSLETPPNNAMLARLKWKMCGVFSALHGGMKRQPVPDSEP